MISKANVFNQVAEYQSTVLKGVSPFITLVSINLVSINDVTTWAFLRKTGSWPRSHSYFDLTLISTFVAYPTFVWALIQGRYSETLVSLSRSFGVSRVAPKVA